MKEEILQSFSAIDGNLRVVIGTIAFAMGIDCPDIREVIQWGPSADLESYIQTTGRAEWDGYVSRATLFHSASEYRYASQAMVNYCMNTVECNRHVLFKEFDDDKVILPCTPCLCFDVCKSHTLCSSGKFPVNDAFLFLGAICKK